MTTHTTCRRRFCPHAAISIVFLAVAAATTAQAYPLFAEDKRQGLIPFPRVGRSPYSMDPSAEMEDLYTDDPLAAILYARALFNPRLGRRKRSIEDGDSLSNLDLEEVGELLRRAPWSLLGYKESNDKKNQLLPVGTGSSMRPRLGRKRSDGGALLDSDMEAAKRGSNSPSASSFSPRLGRSSYNDMERSPPQPNFNPRLGRATVSNTNFSPRLGRSANSEDAKMP